MVNSLAWLASESVHPDTQTRLFCLPQAGGGARDFDAWRQEIPPLVDFCPVQLPGRQDRFAEPAFRDMDSLVSELAEVVAENSDLPFVMYGHCMGALIAFEVARQLRRNRESLPLHLFLSSYFAPQHSEVEISRRIHTFSESDFIETLRGRNILTADSAENPELLGLLLPMLRADYALCETYRYDSEPPLEIPFTVYGAEGDAALRESDLAAWREQTAAAFSVRMLAGDNGSLYRSGAIIGDIMNVLSRAGEQQDCANRNGE